MAIEAQPCWCSVQGLFKQGNKNRQQGYYNDDICHATTVGNHHSPCGKIAECPNSLHIRVYRCLCRCVSSIDQSKSRRNLCRNCRVRFTIHHIRDAGSYTDVRLGLLRWKWFLSGVLDLPRVPDRVVGLRLFIPFLYLRLSRFHVAFPCLAYVAGYNCTGSGMEQRNCSGIV